jgi:hypothetical protein
VKRRDFITLLGGAAAWPLAARAQQRERMRRIGVLMNLPADNPEGQARLAAFLQGLQETGWAVGHNAQIDIRWGGGDAEQMSKQAVEMVALAPDVIFASSNPILVPLRRATRTIPIVFAAVIEPVAAGFVESLARPGGNVTGFSSADYGVSTKWLEVLKDIAPRVTRVAVLYDPSNPGALPQFTAISVAASLLRNVQLPDLAAAADRVLPHGRVHDLAFPFDVARQADVHREQLRHLDPHRGNIPNRCAGGWQCANLLLATPRATSALICSRARGRQGRALSAQHKQRSKSCRLDT